MKNSIRLSLFIIYCLIFSSRQMVAPLDTPHDGLISKTISAELLRGKLLNDAQFENLSPSLMPDNAELKAIFAENSASLKPSMLVESLYLYKKPAPFSKAAWTKAEKTAVLNILVSVSTLAGIQYYSRSRGAMRTFYEKSAVIKDPRQKVIQDDPVFSPDELPSGLTLYARQKDLSMGDNVYRYDYFISDDALIFTQKNCNAISYGIVPLAAKEKLCTISAVIDAGEYFLIYAASMTKAPQFSGLKKKAGDSFGSRAEALIKWLTQRMDGAGTE
ncbi:MAG: hypothetical protein LBB47_05380 [Spirochaetaceae bacterium]|jgi:hypothetical protein|nr:hypothetical protein [Spirochaetaceae bacterium]